MCYFDRFDVCEAYAVYSMLYGPRSDIDARLRRVEFCPAPALSGPDHLTENGKVIFGGLVRRSEREYVAYERLHRRRPDVFPAWPGSRSVGSPARYVRDRLGLDPAALYAVA